MISQFATEVVSFHGTEQWVVFRRFGAWCALFEASLDNFAQHDVHICSNEYLRADRYMNNGNRQNEDATEQLSYTHQPCGSLPARVYLQNNKHKAPMIKLTPRPR